MKDAAKELDEKKSPEAVAKQDKALEALEEARKEIGDKVAEIEKRRDDIAKLEDAAKKLDELAKQEKNVADKADDATPTSRRPSRWTTTRSWPRSRANLTPKANDLAKDIDKDTPRRPPRRSTRAPRTWRRPRRGSTRTRPSPPPRKRSEAAKKLDEAQKALHKALDELKGKEIADQAALQKNTIPQTAAQQVAKALEETEEGRRAAKQAEGQDRDAAAAEGQARPRQAAGRDRQAGRAGEPARGRQGSGQKAAEAIKKGDMHKALENQENALAKLQEAAKKPAAKPMAEPRSRWKASRSRASRWPRASR